MTAGKTIANPETEAIPAYMYPSEIVAGFLLGGSVVYRRSGNR